jgi:hypothetical protein
LEEYKDPAGLADRADEIYAWWDAARKDSVAPPSVEPSGEIRQPGPGVGHVLRGVAPVLEAWRNAGSAFEPGTSVWNA